MKSFQPGTLRWVLRTGLPLIGNFTVTLNNAILKPSKVELKALAEFSVGGADDEDIEIPGVVGTGVSLDDDGNPVIEVYVERAARATPARPIPKELDGVTVRVIETGPVRAY